MVNHMQSMPPLEPNVRQGLSSVRVQPDVFGFVTDIGVFLWQRVHDAVRRARVASRATWRGVYDTSRGLHRQRYVGYRATVKSAITYVVIAAFWEMFEHEFEPMALASALVIGAYIAPGLAPWLRLFPVTGDPTFLGWRRVADLLINLFFHLLSSAVFVFCFKTLIAGAATPLAGEFVLPAFFKGSAGLIAANYLRKFGTEVLGVRVLLPSHPLGPELVSQQVLAPSEHRDHLYLRAWNELREMPGPGCVQLLLRGWGNPPRGYRSLIDESKMLDPALAGLFDHFLR